MIILTYAVGLNNDNNHRIFRESIKKHLPKHKLRIAKPNDNPGQVVHTRWVSFVSELKKMKPEQEVLIVDSRDVVFNRDPWPELAALNSTLVFFSEGQRTADHAWTSNQYQMLMNHLKQRRDVLVLQPEINGGCIYGTAARLLEVAEFMAEEGKVFARTRISDQPVLNNWVRRRSMDRKLLHLHPLYCHGELVRTGKWKGPKPEDCAIYHQFERDPVSLNRYRTEYSRVADSKDFELVVSRYEEDPSIVAELFPRLRTTIYNKGKTAVPGSIPLPNVGYEAHTWLHHFHENYDQLPKVTLCVQGNPQPHLGKDRDFILSVVEGIDPDKFSLMPLGLGGSWQGSDGAPHHRGLTELSVLWPKLLGYPCPTLFHSFYGGQFAVHRDRVRSRPKEAYAAALKMIKSKEDACAMERMWSAWFLT